MGRLLRALARVLPPRSRCAGCGRPWFTDERRPCAACGSTARNFSVSAADAAAIDDSTPLTSVNRPEA